MSRFLLLAGEAGFCRCPMKLATPQRQCFGYPGSADEVLTIQLSYSTTQMYE